MNLPDEPNALNKLKSLTYADAADAYKAWGDVVRDIKATVKYIDALRTALTECEANHDRECARAEDNLKRLTAAEARVVELKNHIADVNNSVFGSHSFFMEPSCVKGIEDMKRLSNEAWRRERERAEAAEARAGKLQELVDLGNKAFIEQRKRTLSAEARADAEPIATLQLSDPFDERDGPWFSQEDLRKLRALPPGTKLYIRSA